MPDTDHTKIALMEQKVEYIKKKVDLIALQLEDKYVTKEEFALVRNIVFTTVGLILLAVIGAIISLVVK